MSQAGIISTSSGPVPPDVPTSFVTDDGTAIPALNILNVLGTSSSLIFDGDGIRTTGSGNTLNIVLTNRFFDSVTTSDALGQSRLLSDRQLTADGVYTFNMRISGANETDSTGAAYSLFFGVKLVSGTATKLGLEDKISNEEASMVDCNVLVGVSGDSVQVTVVGIATKTIHWDGLAEFTYTSFV